MNKKILILIMLVIVIIVAAIIIVVYSMKNDYKNIQGNKSSNVREEIKEIYQYGEEVINMDIAPNTVVARINGEEILKCEVDVRQYSLNYAIENDGNEEMKNDNAFYEVLAHEIIVQKYKKEGRELGEEYYERQIERTLNMPDKELQELYEMHKIEENEKWLTEVEFKNFIIEGILDMHRWSGISILDYALENRDAVENGEYLQKLQEYNEITKLQEEQMKEIREQQGEERQTNTIIDNASFSRRGELLTELRELYTEELILNSDLELCVEEGKLSTKIPPEYIKNQENVSRKS